MVGMMKITGMTGAPALAMKRIFAVRAVMSRARKRV